LIGIGLRGGNRFTGEANSQDPEGESRGLPCAGIFVGGHEDTVRLDSESMIARVAKCHFVFSGKLDDLLAPRSSRAGFRQVEGGERRKPLRRGIQIVRYQHVADFVEPERRAQQADAAANECVPNGDCLHDVGFPLFREYPLQQNRRIRNDPLYQ